MVLAVMRIVPVASRMPTFTKMAHRDAVLIGVPVVWRVLQTIQHPCVSTGAIVQVTMEAILLWTAHLSVPYVVEQGQEALSHITLAVTVPIQPNVLVVFVSSQAIGLGTVSSSATTLAVAGTVAYFTVLFADNLASPI